MSTQPQRDVIREGFANIPANQSTTQAAPGARATEFKDQPVLTQSTDAELKLAFAENLFDLFRAMTHLPNSELEETPGLSRHFAFPFNPMFKGVWQTRLAESETEKTIIDSLAWFKARHAPFFFWWIDPRAQPADLAERLKAHGFAAWEENAPGMAAAMNDLRFDLVTRVPPEFEMRRVQDERDLIDFKTALVAGMGVPEWAGQAWVDATLAYGIERAPWKLYVGRLNGKPVASNMLFCGAGVASVFGVATAPEARGQGIGAAITLIAYDDARQLGYRYAVLFATDLGAPVYRRIGFKDMDAGMSRYLWRA